VILRSPYVGLSLIKHSQYKQMVGRAGRAGIDSSGESFLIVNRQDAIKVKEMLSGPQDVCHSSLGFEDGKGVKALLLSAIGLKMVTSTEDAYDLMRRSLLHIQCKTSGVDTRVLTDQAVSYLVDKGLITHTQSLSSSGGFKLTVSPIGRATFKGSLDHTFSGQLYEDLKASESSLNLSTYLHLLYLVTPYDTALDVTPSWDIYFKKFCSLSETEAKVANAVGVPEHYLGLKAAGRSSRKKVCQLKVNRFYLTLMLWDLWKQQTVWQVAEVFSQTRGFVQNLLSQAATFAFCVLHYCQELEEFWAYQVLLERFVKRLAYCVTFELVPLMDVPGVKLARAKQLYAAGYRSISLLAAADEAQLVSCVDHMTRRTAAQIVSAAKNILEEKRAALTEEIESLTAQDMTSDL
ncbi:helicase POLQ-like protein, partial [Elysia marginata]